MKIVNYKDFKSLDFVNSGYFSNCYLSESGELVKIIKSRQLESYEHVFNKEHLEKLSELNNQSFIAPEKAIMENDKVIGYTTRFINGKSIANMDDNLKIVTVLESYKKLKEDIIKLSEEKQFLLVDIHSDNILFDGKFRIIDLDLGYFYKGEGTILLNTYKTEKAILHNMFSMNSSDFFHFNDSTLKELYKCLTVDYESCIFEYFERIFNIFDRDDLTLGEIKKIGRELVYK